ARAADLERGLRVNVLGLPEQYTVLDSAGHEVAHSAFSQPATLIEGSYRLQATYGGNAIEREFTITGGSTTTVTLQAPGTPVAANDPTSPATRPSGPHVSPVTEIVKRFCTNCGAQLGP